MGAFASGGVKLLNRQLIQYLHVTPAEIEAVAERESTRSFDQRRLQRAIGVIYRPETERMSHYFEAELRKQFDLLHHSDTTRAVEPLERTWLWTRGELPET